MPDIDTFLSTDVSGDAAASLSSTSRQDEVAQLDSPNKGPNSTAFLPSWPSDDQAPNTCSVSRQHAALYDGNVSPDINKLLSTPKGHEIIDTGDSSNSTSTSKSRMLAIANMLVQLAGS